jgi:hypothetical protein
MDWLNPFNHVDRHPRTVAIILVGLLVAGTISGSLYTRALQHELSGFRSASHQQLATWEQRLEIARENRSQDSLRFSERLRIADAQIQALFTGVAGVDRSTRRLLTEIRSIAPSVSTDSNRLASLQTTIDSIEFQLDSVRSAMITAGLMAQLLEPRTHALAPDQPKTVKGSTVNYILLSTLGIIALIVFLSANFFLDTKRRREIRELQRRLAAFENASR